MAEDIVHFFSAFSSYANSFRTKLEHPSRSKNESSNHGKNV